MENRIQWFTERLGKVVYPSENICSCDGCKSDYQNGIKITDSYIFETLLDFEAGGTLRHFDTKQEAMSYSNCTSIENKVKDSNITPKAVTIHYNKSGWYLRFKSVAAKVKFRKHD